MISFKKFVAMKAFKKRYEDLNNPYAEIQEPENRPSLDANDMRK